MLSLEDPRSWFAIAALATALVFTSVAAQGTLRCGYYTGFGQNCFTDADSGNGAKVFRQMADERRRCSYVEPACRVRDTRHANGSGPAAAIGGGFPAPPRGTGARAPRHGSGPPQPGGG
jgi:hypothetical protein